jgi:streptogramin lyase
MYKSQRGLLNVFFAILFIFLCNENVKAVAPVISYTNPPTFIINSAITTISPVATGVSAFGYSSGTALIGGTVSGPSKIATDPSGNVYVANFRNNTINEYNPTGIYIGTFGSGGPGLNGPVGLVFDSNGNAYILNTGNGQVQKYNSVGAYQSTIVTVTSGSYGVAIDASNSIYITIGNTIKKYGINGTLLLTINTNLSNPTDVVVDASGNIFALNFNGNNITEYNSSGNYLGVFASGLNKAYTLSIDKSGYIYVGDSGNNSLKIYNSTGTLFSNIIVADPEGVEVDSYGNLYVASYSANKVYKFIPSGGYSINGTLPLGLSFNKTTGQISGTPSVIFTATTYTITAYNSSGNSSASIVLAVSQSINSGNYAFSQPIILNTSSITGGITSTLSNFPTLVYIKEDALKTGVSCANNIQFPSGGINGYDFAFTTNGSSTELFYQVENFDPVTGTLLVWVQVPIITSTNANLIFYFGSLNPSHTAEFTSATWASDYQAVFHFNEGISTAAISDATVNARNATQANTTVATGQIGGAYNFNGSTSQIISTSTANNITGSFTLSAWVNSSSFNSHTDQKIITNESSYSLGGYKLSLYGSATNSVYNEVETRANNGTVSLDRSATGGTPLTTTKWYYVQGIYDNSTNTFYSYVDGKLDRSLSGAVASGNNGGNLIIGSDFVSGNWFYGIIDEVRVSNIAKTADWLKAEYYNQTHQTSFTTIGAVITGNLANAAAIGGSIVYTWTGATNTVPTLASNWASSAIRNLNQAPPFDGTCTLVIPAGLANYPTLTANMSIYGLTLNGNASINLNGYILSVGCNIYNSGTGLINWNNNNLSGINWDGIGSQSYNGNSGTSGSAHIGTMLVNNSGDGIVTINNDSLDIYHELLILQGNISVAPGGFMALKSSATQTANVAEIPVGDNITGNVTVERYMPGGSKGYRSYRLLTLPVNISNLASQNGVEGFIDLHSLNNGMLTAGPGTGFSYLTKTTNPLIYLYDESRPHNYTTFVGGKNVGIYSMIGAPTYNVTYYPKGSTAIAAPTAIAQVPVGNSVQAYFVGPSGATNLSAVSPLSATISSTGYLNQGTIPVYIFSTGSTALSYNPIINPTPADWPGINQVGNPYPCTIDLDSLYYDNKGNSINISPIFWEQKNPYNTFVAYNAATHTVSNVDAEPYVASGQGFYVAAVSNTSKLSFYEDEKVNVQLGTTTTPVLMLNQKSTNTYLATNEIASTGLAGLHLQISKDTVTSIQTGIYFNKTSSDNYDPKEDAIDIDGTPEVFLSSYSNDGIRLCINEMADYSKGKIIKLYASALNSGSYSIGLIDIKNIDTIYNIYLRDHLLNDSVNLRKSSPYNFTINTNDTTTYGANRFDLSIMREALPAYQLMSFTGEKVNTGILLSWGASNAGNYTSFILQKEDENNKFNPIDSVQSNGNIEYSYIDIKPNKGENIYCLEQNDIDGNIVYSQLVTIDYSNTSSNGFFAIYPNPSNSVINVLINSPESMLSTYTADIYNASGMLVDHRVLNTSKWTQDVSSYNDGIYIMALKDGNGHVMAESKFIKIK